MNNTLQEHTSVHTLEILKGELAHLIVCEMFENSVICLYSLGQCRDLVR